MLDTSNITLLQTNGLDSQSSDVIVLPNDNSTVETINIEHEAFLFTADFSREGYDLRITGENGQTVLIENYFLSDTPADLVAPAGGILSGSVVEALAGPMVTGSYAQVGEAQGAIAIGQVESASGTVRVQRTDGTIENLEVGTKVFQNDVVITESDSTLSVTFLDGTIFTLSQSSRMVLSELVYAPGGENNSAVFNLVEGGFVFIAGEVAKTGNMDVKTPVATMGIRGTTVKVDIETTNGITTVEVSLNTDPDGTIGNFTITGLNGEVIADVQAVDTKWIIAPDGNSATEVERLQVDFGQDLILINQAYAAYQAAQGRVQGGGNFVEPENVGPGENEGQQNQNNDDDTPGDQGQLNGSGLETEFANNGEGSGNGVFIPELNPTPNSNNDNPSGTTGGSGIQPNFIEPDVSTPLDPNLETTTGPLTITVPTTVAAVSEDGSSSIGGFGFTAPSGSTLDVSITLGSTLRLNPGSGVIILSGELEPGTTDQYHSLVIQGTAAQINAALNGATYTPTPDDDDGGFIRIVAFDGETTVEVQVDIPITPSNDAPFVGDLTVEVEEGGTVSGSVIAFDVDGDNVSFIPTFEEGEVTEAGGYIEFNSDGTFTYTAPSAYVGFDSYTVTVTDDAANPLTATGTIEFEIANETAQSGTGQDIEVVINADAVDNDPLGNLSFNLSSFNAPNINLVFAMDASGSVGAGGWSSTIAAVSGAISALNASLAGSPVDVNVHIFQFAGGNAGNNILTLDTNNSNGIGNAGTNLFSFNLQDDLASITTQLATFPFSQGGTPWGAAFDQAIAFFDSQPGTDQNYLYFLTDGQPSGNNSIWQTPLAELKGDNVQIEAFGIGDGFNTAQLQQVDSTPTGVDAFSGLADALAASGLFPATVVSYSLNLTVDGVNIGEIADETSNPLANNASSFDLALADIDNIENILGGRNEFSVTTTIDLDGDLATTGDQVTLNSFEAINFGTASRTRTGTDGNDLMLGSDFNDVLNGNGGEDVLLTGAGNDTVIVSDTNFKAIRGGIGIDELNILGDNLNLDFTNISSDAVEGIEIIEFNGSGSSITLDEQNVQNFTDETNTSYFLAGEQGLFISGDGDDTLNLDHSGNSQGSWNLDQGRTTASTEYYNFMNGSDVIATVAVDDAVNVNIVV